MEATIDSLQSALHISRTMMARLENGDWEGIVELQAKRDALLANISPTEAQRELWEELLDLNNQLVAALQDLRDERVLAAADEQRQRRLASVYQEQ